MLYDALSLGKKTPKIDLPPRDFVTPPEEDQVTAIGKTCIKLVKFARAVREICSRIDRQMHTHTHSLQYFATAPACEVTM